MRTQLAIAALSVTVLILSVGELPAKELVVYQDLEEVTSRIHNLGRKPYKALIDASDGFFQNEVIIFRDLETGNEVWSLSREKCRDMADHRRRPAWSCNGRYMSFHGNQAYWDYKGGKMVSPTGTGHTYIANADGSRKRPLWAKVDGGLRRFDCSTHNMWDAKRPDAWYCIREGWLWRVTVGQGVTDSKADKIYEFRGCSPQTINYVNESNSMLVSQMRPEPRCFVIDLNRDADHPHFCLSRLLRGPFNLGSLRLMRSRKALRGHYLQGGQAATINLSFENGKTLDLRERNVEDEIHITEGRRMHHLWYGPPDDRVGFFGTHKEVGGLYLQIPGSLPVLMARVGDGHVTWCGRDPEWFFAAVGPGTPGVSYRDKQYMRRLIACKSDGKTVKVICTPFDRRRVQRGDDGGYLALPLPVQSPDGTKCRFHSSMLYDSDRHTGSFVAVFRKPYPPVAIRLKRGIKDICLEWTPHKLSHEVKGYHVYRSEDDGRTFREITDAAVIGANAFSDTSARTGKTYIYAVTAEEWSRLESDCTSPTVKVAMVFGGPRQVSIGDPIESWDRTPPASTDDFSAAMRPDGLIALTWQVCSDRGLRHYNIYSSSRGRPDVCQKRLLVSPTHDQTSYIDWTAPEGKTVHYAITAVDRKGNESLPVYTKVAARRNRLKN